ncbi:bifunctional 2-polyprenyl-6-hydroxyphenol methylase/3-demethylubiquinol 3-O-methyltransferase UbiG [Streptomyces sp. AP-93]|uniref:class I SAM-dependent methyltransferase n=1 Tax=Streptomyces sp. AP-93 TaxID=2929048 RepID=UPI001FAEA4B6|nr:class I SAM-dependent methyltransferase [Streptomyces sp. AP-93]MCJ0869697.1 class I SAM-dependent methyltransferase [Streptomyces sp. AP-93]
MTSTAAYWDPLWTQGRRYRRLDAVETRLLDEHLGPGRGRPALDIGCGDGALTRHLHHQLGYRTTGIDCSPSALALAAARDCADRPGPLWRCADIGADDLTALPERAYAVITCRLVYRWLDAKGAFVNRVRRLLVPGGVFWVVTEITGRRKDTDPLQGLGISPAEAEILTAGWSVVRTHDLDVLRCYALRP